MAGAVPGKVEGGYWGKGVVGHGTDPQGMVTFSRSIWKTGTGIVGVAVQGQQLD